MYNYGKNALRKQRLWWDRSLHLVRGYLSARGQMAAVDMPSRVTHAVALTQSCPHEAAAFSSAPCVAQALVEAKPSTGPISIAGMHRALSVPLMHMLLGTQLAIKSAKDIPAHCLDKSGNLLSDIQDFYHGAQFTVFPNPVSDQLVVAGLNQSVQMDISLFDAAQREVLKTSCIGQTILDVSSLSPGVYLVAVRTAYGRSHTKVSVQ